MKTYTGIGSRETPSDVLQLMEHLAYDLAARGWTLRSGGAEGADSAFADGAWNARHAHRGVEAPEIYLPWPKFNGIRTVLTMRDEPQAEAFPIAARFHPAWDKVSRGGRALHARNVHQVLGPDVTAPLLSRFVVCWTPDARRGGGTGQALRIAEHYNVPIFDLADPASRRRVEDFWNQ